MTRACDLIVSGGLFFLLLFTPFAFGTVHPWAYMTMEATIFVLVAAWMTKLICLGRWTNALGDWLPKLAAPLALFLGLAAFQLLPLPPALIKFFSPNAYNLYSTSLPGWPEKSAYGELAISQPTTAAFPRLLPTVDQMAGDPAIPTSHTPSPIGATPPWESARIFPEHWRALSIAPALGATDLLKLIAYGWLFFTIVLYPLTADRTTQEPSANHQSLRIEARYLRALVFVILCSGLLVALVGIVQRFAGNGKILWGFIPYDWGSAHLGTAARASGPFINPDHFANYLAVIFPLALALALRPQPWFAAKVADFVRISCATVATVLFIAILLSLSRVGWFSALFSMGLLFGFTPGMRGFYRDALARRRSLHKIAFMALAATILITLSLWLIGPHARQAVDQRLAETIAEAGGLTSRIALWRDSFGMIRDFPLLGVGLGAWSEGFPRYQNAALSEAFFREAHNDFLELIAETGVLGFALLGLFFFAAGRLIWRSLSFVPRDLSGLLIAALAALGTIPIHEFFDFSLQIPANALLFTVLFALTVRLATRSVSRTLVRDVRPRPWLPVSAMGLSAAFSACALTQDLVPYPHNLRSPTTIAEAAERIAAYPAQAVGHAMMGRLLIDRAPTDVQTREFAIAAKLSPNDPHVRDLYASALLRAGRREQGLQEIHRSVVAAPSLEAHFYLSNRILPWLSTDEKQAIETGFKQALAQRHPLAQVNLAKFYEQTGQFSEQAKLFESSAAHATSKNTKDEFTILAGLSYLRANEIGKAEAILRRAIALRPDDSRPYQSLALAVYAPAREKEKIAAVIAEGLGNHAPALPLYYAMAEAMHLAGAAEETTRALAQAENSIKRAAASGENVFPAYLSLAATAQKLGRHDDERAALAKAMEIRPNSAETLGRLGYLYLQSNNYERAAIVLKRLSELRPTSADTFYQLGLAEEGRFGFAAADAAYARAAQLAPETNHYRERRIALQKHMTDNRQSIAR